MSQLPDFKVIQTWQLVANPININHAIMIVNLTGHMHHLAQLQFFVSQILLFFILLILFLCLINKHLVYLDTIQCHLTLKSIAYIHIYTCVCMHAYMNECTHMYAARHT